MLRHSTLERDYARRVLTHIPINCARAPFDCEHWMTQRSDATSASDASRFGSYFVLPKIRADGEYAKWRAATLMTPIVSVESRAHNRASIRAQAIHAAACLYSMAQCRFPLVRCERTRSSFNVEAYNRLARVNAVMYALHWCSCDSQRKTHDAGANICVNCVARVTHCFAIPFTEPLQNAECAREFSCTSHARHVIHSH